MGTLLLAVLATTQIRAQIDLQPTSSTHQIQRVQLVLEGRGVVRPEEKQTMRMSVDARFEYDERVIARTTQLKSVRSYDTAQARIRLDNKPLVNQLSADKSIVIVQTAAPDQALKLAAIGGPLTQNEFELINTPANTLILGEIFEKRSVRKGDTWTPDEQVLARFLNIDTVDETDVQIELADIRDGLATLVIAGETTGVIDGAITELSLNGSVRFNTESGTVTAASITISQQRDIGLVAPGLDATFKIVMKIQPVADSPHLTNQGLTRLREQASSITDELLLTPESSPVTLRHPRQWRVIANHPARTVLRYTRRGLMVGQCDIIPLPERLPNQEQSLEQFRSVVKNKLAENSGQITAANQSRSKQGLEWMRVEATGSSNGVNLNWIYYTINSQDGRRVQLVFTTEPGYVKSFSALENYLIDSLQFEPAGKTPARTVGHRQTESPDR
jgi:hypothetical protein